MVGELRESTGAGLMDCKRALVESEGNVDKAVEILRKKGAATAAKKASREASEGLVNSYIHLGGKVGVLVEVNCESDFVAKTDDFKAFVRDIAMHIAATNPVCVSREEIDPEIIKKERVVAEGQAEGKPPRHRAPHLPAWQRHVSCHQFSGGTPLSAAGGAEQPLPAPVRPQPVRQACGAAASGPAC